MVRPQYGYGAAGRYSGYKRKAGGVAWNVGAGGGGSKRRRFVVGRAGGRLRRRNVRTAGYLGIETKFWDKAYDAAIVNTTAGAEADPAANSSCLNSISQGDGESNRDGRRCVVKSMQIRGYLQGTALGDQADVPPAVIVRVLVVKDCQTNGVQLNSEDVLSDPASEPLAMINLQHSRRFRILWDRTFVCPRNAAAEDGANTNSTTPTGHVFNIYKKMSMPVTFDGTTDDIANITDNSLHVIAFANTTGMTLRYTSRVRFVG